MGKVVGTVLKVVGIAALTFVTVGVGSALLAGATLAAATTLTALGTALLVGGSLALTVGNGLLAKDKAQKAAASARAEQIRAMVNPQAKANWCFGETATAVQIVYSEVMGSKKDTAALIYAGPAHPVDSYGQLYINDDAVSFSGNDATGAWAGAVSRYTNLGSESQAALAIPGSTWPSTARGRGFAHFGLKWFLGKDKLKDGLPDRLTQVVKGAPVYDPRLDSTVGGSGTQRANDQTTWAYSNSVSADAGANWALVCLHYILGWKNNGKLVYGRGADALDIDYASFITAANVCDALVDGIPRYHIGGIERIDGDHARVIGALEATIGGKISKSGGMYHCWAPNDDLVAAETISENDLIRDAGVNFQDARSIQNIYNVGQGQFIDPSALYQPAPYPEVVEASAVTDLGRERIMPYDTVFLQDEKRAQRVVLQQIRRSLYGRVWRYGVGPKFFRRKVFDIVNLNIKETNFTDTFARITEKTTSPNGLIIFTLEEENSLIYDVTATLGTLAARNVPPTFDAATNIPVTTLVLSAVSVTGTGGTASDALQVSYDDPGPLVNRTDIEYQVQGATNWQPAASKVLDAGIAIISPVESGTTYYVRVRHWTVFDVPSVWVTDFVIAGQAQVAGAVDFANVVGVTKPLDRIAATFLPGVAESNKWVRVLQANYPSGAGRSSGILKIAATGGQDNPGELEFAYSFNWGSQATIHFRGGAPVKLSKFRVLQSGDNMYLDILLGTFAAGTRYELSVIPETLVDTGGATTTIPLTISPSTAGVTTLVSDINIIGVVKGHHQNDIFTQTLTNGSKVVNGNASTRTDGLAEDTFKVNGWASATVQSNAQTGWDLTQFNGIVLDPSSFGTMDLADLDPARQGKLDGVAPGADVTLSNIAASVVGQGALATKGAVDLSTTEVINKSLLNLDSAANTKLTGIAIGATKNLGALADKNDVNLAGSFVIGLLPTTKAADGLKNVNTTPSDIGYIGDLDATRQVNQGAYAGATTYAKGDVVTSGGSSYEYINAASSAGNAPPNATYWALLASQGNPGSTGATGNKIKFAYIASATQPATPTGTTFPPAGWSSAPPGGSSSIWVVQVEYTGSDVYVGPWSTPAQFANPGTTARSGVASIGVPVTIANTTSTVLGSIITLDLGPDGSHSVNYTLNFKSVDTGPSTLYAKIQWRPVGGAWTDLTTEKSSISGSNVEPAILADSLVTVFSGVQVAHEFRLMVRKSGSSTNLTGASAKASWTNA